MSNPLPVDCDKDTLLAKGGPGQELPVIPEAVPASTPADRGCMITTRPILLQVFESVYGTIDEPRRIHPKEGSYTNYLFDKGIDKILKKARRRGNGNCDRPQRIRIRKRSNTKSRISCITSMVLDGRAGRDLGRHYETSWQTADRNSVLDVQRLRITQRIALYGRIHLY